MAMLKYEIVIRFPFYYYDLSSYQLGVLLVLSLSFNYDPNLANMGYSLYGTNTRMYKS